MISYVRCLDASSSVLDSYDSILDTAAHDCGKEYCEFWRADIRHIYIRHIYEGSVYEYIFNLYANASLC